MATLRDGLGGEELGDAVDAGSKVNQLWITGSVTSESQISGANVYANTNVECSNILGTTGSISDLVNTEGELQSVSVETTFGARIQTGSGTLSSNVLWVTYPVEYTVNPMVFVEGMTSATDIVRVQGGQTGTGSFAVSGAGATDEFSWISVGY